MHVFLRNKYMLLKQHLCKRLKFLDPIMVGNVIKHYILHSMTLIKSVAGRTYEYDHTDQLTHLSLSKMS